MIRVAGSLESLSRVVSRLVWYSTARASIDATHSSSLVTARAMRGGRGVASGDVCFL